LTKNKDHFNKHFQGIFNFEHPKSSNFADIESLDKLVNRLKQEEKRLNDEYKKLSEILEEIQVSMR
jgi:hypothetical protein